MYLLLTDETNKEPSADANFFVYGGIFFPFEKLQFLHKGISKVRGDAGYKSEDEFKFDTRSRPSYVTQEAHTRAKKEATELCLTNDVKFIVHLIHHGIIRHQGFPEQITKAADYVIGRYNYFLTENNDHGICVIDNVPIREQFGYLSKKFQIGLNIPSQGRDVKLEKILLYAASTVNASHVNSAMDIILGSFRYCVNNPRNPDAASEMMKKIISMMWAVEKSGKKVYEGYGFILRPKPISLVEPYKSEYNVLVDHINLLLNR